MFHGGFVGGYGRFCLGRLLLEYALPENGGLIKRRSCLLRFGGMLEKIGLRSLAAGHVEGFISLFFRCLQTEIPKLKLRTGKSGPLKSAAACVKGSRRIRLLFEAPAEDNNVKTNRANLQPKVRWPKHQ